MHIEIAGLDYTIRVVQGRLFHDHCEYLSLCDHGEHEILVSDRVPLENQAAIVGRAVSDAWKYRTESWTRVLPLVPMET